MKTKNIVGFLAILILMQVQVTLAQTAAKTFDSWHLLGTRTVDYTIDRDVVDIKDLKSNVTGLKFIVKNGTVNMHKATVHFTNGDTQDIQFQDEVNKNNDGRLVELKGNSRAIEKITFWYDTVNNSKDKATVEVWGK